MNCPNCDVKLSVLDTRKTQLTYPVKIEFKRRRACPKCDYKITTYEVTRDNLMKYAETTKIARNKLEIIKKFFALINK